MINFYLPDFVTNASLIYILADFREHFPQWFYDDCKISAAYGSFGNCIWSGGRSFTASTNSREMEQTIKTLNDHGIAVRYTFTNPLLEEKHLYDTYSNLCLKLADNGMNEVIINSPLLEQYIRENYPGFKLISSTTKCIDTIDGLRDELKKEQYYLVVADSALNNTPELLSIEDRGRIELIANHYCQDNCPSRRAHYEEVARSNLEFRTSEFKCKNIGRNFYQIMKNRSFITTDQIYGEYKAAGFQHYKLDGRMTTPSNNIECFIYYLIKPEFRDMVRMILLKELYRM